MKKCGRVEVGIPRTEGGAVPAWGDVWVRFPGKDRETDQGGGGTDHFFSAIVHVNGGGGFSAVEVAGKAACDTVLDAPSCAHAAMDAPNKTDAAMDRDLKNLCAKAVKMKL